MERKNRMGYSSLDEEVEKEISDKEVGTTSDQEKKKVILSSQNSTGSTISTAEKKEEKSLIPPKAPQLPPKALQLTSLLFLVLAIFLIMLYSLYSEDNESPAELTTFFPYKLYSQKFAELSTEFSRQPPLTYKTINLTIYDTLDTDEPEGPGVILLLGTEGNYDITERIENRLSELLKESFNENMHHFNCRSLATLNPYEAKMILNNEITSVFDKKKSSFLILDGIDNLPSEIVSILQPFFDHENAPYKRVIFLLTAVTEERLTSNAIKATRMLAMNHFDKKWAGYPSEHRDAMYSRMLNSVAVIVPE